jgi:hypothetical protein
MDAGTVGCTGPRKWEIQDTPNDSFQHLYGKYIYAPVSVLYEKLESQYPVVAYTVGAIISIRKNKERVEDVSVAEIQKRAEIVARVREKAKNAVKEKLRDECIGVVDVVFEDVDGYVGSLVRNGSISVGDIEKVFRARLTKAFLQFFALGSSVGDSGNDVLLQS